MIRGPVMDAAHRGAGRDHEGKVLETGRMSRVSGRRLRGIEEQEGPALAARRLVGELVLCVEEALEADQRHELVVVPLRLRKIGDVDTEMSEHGTKSAPTTGPEAMSIRDADHAQERAACAGIGGVKRGTLKRKDASSPVQRANALLTDRARRGR